MSENERRKNTRVPFQTTADLIFSDKSYQKCETENLSVKGVSIPGVVGHQINEECEVSLALSGTTSELRLEMKGKVVRVTAEGIGIQFTEIDLDSFYHLKNIVYYNAEDPDQIETELA